MTQQRSSPDTLVALCAELGSDLHDHVHREGERVAIYSPELHRYLIIEEGGRMWWTNDLLQVWPELVSADQYAAYSETFKRSKQKEQHPGSEYDLLREDVADDGELTASLGSAEE